MCEEKSTVCWIKPKCVLSDSLCSRVRQSGNLKRLSGSVTMEGIGLGLLPHLLWVFTPLWLGL